MTGRSVTDSTSPLGGFTPGSNPGAPTGMKKHFLKIKQRDKFVFDAIKNGGKTIETRAGSVLYNKIEPGDILVFVCGKEKLEKKVVKATHFKSADDMLKYYDYKKIQPFSDSLEEAKKLYDSFTNYKERLKEFGILAFELE